MLRKVALTKYTGKESKLGQVKHHVFVYKLFDKWKLIYRAFCAGSIITLERVLTSSNCLLTNRKRRRVDFNQVRIAGGILLTVSQQPISDDDVQQWRSLAHVYSQKFFRHPGFDLAILKTDKPWVFNQFVNKIPYASTNHDYDGTCFAPTVMVTKSWSMSKFLSMDKRYLIKRRACEQTLLRSCELFICTAYTSHNADETQGGGLICHGTNDPSEKDEQVGVLVGVTTVVNIGLPSLHTRVGLFNKWVTDGCRRADTNMFLLCIICWFIKLL